MADNFELNLRISSKLNSFEQFQVWTNTISNKIKHSISISKNIIVEHNEDSPINVSVEIVWEGISVENKNIP